MEATELIARRRRPRQYRTTEEKRLVVEQTLKPGVSVAAVAQAHGVNANQVFHWRKLYEAGQLEIPMAMSVHGADACPARLLAVTMSEDESRQTPGTTAMEHIAGGDSLQGTIEVTLARGTIRIAGAVDTGTLRAVLGCLLA
jgi:transposase